MSDGQTHLVPDHEHRCRFVKSSGARCTSMALRDRDLCFDHNRKRELDRGSHKPSPPSGRFALVPLVSFAWVEDHHSILCNLNQIAHALDQGVINAREAGAATSLMRTCLKTLRQMHDLEKVQKPVQDYVLEQGLPLVPPDRDADGHPIDPHADPNHPGVSFDPDTDEGRKNRQQRLLWRYFCNDPASGVPSGLNINWPGRPASFVPPAPAPEPGPASAPEPGAPSKPDSGLAGVPQSSSGPVSEPSLTLTACADPSLLTPAESMYRSAKRGQTPLESTHAHDFTLNPCLSHTYAISRKFSQRGAGGAAKRALSSAPFADGPTR
jgi:hypothetical protein